MTVLGGEHHPTVYVCMGTAGERQTHRGVMERAADVAVPAHGLTACFFKGE